ncbi:threonine/serine exporter family protein [Microcella pacifica]|uniref:threonine/serine ThrE exporter family protein n=1 Tax=Microcella pacifica TaxID=2591847 RepID=UPI002E29208A|nr:threonine/serine exporter family protein [Microcella pacifica]
MGNISDNGSTAPRPRKNRSLFQIADGVLRGSTAPTQVISVAGGHDQSTQRHVRLVIDLCLRVGEAMLATGASAADVVAMVLRISEAYGVGGMHVDITFTSITVSVHRGMNEDPVSVMRIVKVRTTDYTRLQNVYWLIDQITGDGMRPTVEVARERLTAILSSPHPYRRWVVTAGKAILAGGVVVLFDVGLVLVLVAAVSAVISDLITRQLGKWSVPGFFAQMAAAVATTSIAVLLFWLRSVGIELPGSEAPTVIVIAGIVMLLSGLGLTAAARDAIDGYYVTATARGMEVFMLTLGLAVGISAVLGIALRMGIPVAVSTSLGDSIGLVAGVVGAALIGCGFALTSYVRLRLVPLMSAATALVFAVFLLVSPYVSQPGLAPGIAAVAAGIIGYLTYRWIKVPEGATTTAAIIGLIPGLAVYSALYVLVDSTTGVMEALPAAVDAIATGIGLAAGTAIGGFAARRTFGLDRQAMIAGRRTLGVR